MPFRHVLPRATVLAAALFALTAAAGSEHAPAPAPKAAAAEPVKAPAAAKAKSAIDPARDPLDLLRERLAQKLGATKPPDATTPNVIRVVSKASAGGATEHADDPGTLRLRPRQARAGAGAGAGAKASALPAAAAAAVAALPPAGHWDYAGAGGPESWARMSPEFSKCATGTRQSPIDIREGIRVELDPVRFDYKPSGFRVVDTGHTVQVNLAAGNSIEVLGRRYELVQFHFHRPSEERIDGKQFDMVAHLVHKDLEGRLAVVAVLLDRGSAHGLVQSVWNNLPLEKGEEVAARSLLDLNELLPPERRYFTYMGSMTTPPCSEGVLWMVMKQPVPISAEQIGIFARLYPMNARPVQSAGGRLIKESN